MCPKKVDIFIKLYRTLLKGLLTRAVQLIACDVHLHLISKASSVISSKSPSHAFRWSGI